MGKNYSKVDKCLSLKNVVLKLREFDIWICKKIKNKGRV